MGSNPCTANFHIIEYQPSASEVLNGRLSSSTAVVHSARYPPGRANSVAVNYPYM